MSQLLKGLADYVRNMPGVNVRVTLTDSLSDESLVTLGGSEPDKGGFDLEGRSVDGVAVGTPEPGPFTCFLDGMQRPRGPIYIDSPVPIVYGYVAATIRARGPDRRMRTFEGIHESREALYLSYSVAEKFDESKKILDDLKSAGLSIQDTDRVGEPPTEHPLALIQAARDAVSTARGAIEEKLIGRWFASHCRDNGWLLIDGSLPDSYAESQIIGVTKSHGTQYFPWPEQQKILALKVGERSGVFIPIIRGKRRAVYSWYLRLHPNEGRDLYFGLVRVEVPQKQAMLEMADTISRWLLAERTPLSLPDSRWDKMIYPIRDCEQYLKSRAPSHASLDALLMRLANITRAPR